MLLSGIDTCTLKYIKTKTKHEFYLYEDVALFDEIFIRAATLDLYSHIDYMNWFVC